jgi:hypothetical protein
MARLNYKQGYFLALLLILSCSKSRKLEFIYLDEVLNHKSIHESSEQLLVDLKYFLYLGEDVQDIVHRTYPEYFSLQRIDKSDFIIHPNDKLIIGLNREYSTIDDLLKNIDSNLKNYLADKLGLDNLDESMQKRILVYNDRAFVEFVQSHGVHALTFELIDAKRVTVGIAFISVI